MRRGKFSVCGFIFILFISCSSTNQENETPPISDETLDNQAIEEVKEPANSIWVSAKKGDVESIKQHIASPNFSIFFTVSSKLPLTISIFASAIKLLFLAILFLPNTPIKKYKNSTIYY